MLALIGLSISAQHLRNLPLFINGRSGMARQWQSRVEAISYRAQLAAGWLLMTAGGLLGLFKAAAPVVFMALLFAGGAIMMATLVWRRWSKDGSFKPQHTMQPLAP